MSESDPQFGAGEPELPPRLREALVRLHDPGIAVPAMMDDAILTQARRTFHQRRQRWTAARWAASVAAAAAIIAVALRVFTYQGNGNGQTGTPRPQLAQLADINHDGRVDIVDAYVVARKIARHEPLDPTWDVNGDGVIDEKDVDLIAHLAVQVGGDKPQ